jgi:hypothetical protein
MEANKKLNQKEIQPRRPHASSIPIPPNATPEEQLALKTLARLNGALEQLGLPTVVPPGERKARRRARRRRPTPKPPRPPADVSRLAHEAHCSICSHDVSLTRHAAPGNFLRKRMKTITVATHYSTPKKAKERTLELPDTSFCTPAARYSSSASPHGLATEEIVCGTCVWEGMKNAHTGRMKIPYVSARHRWAEGQLRGGCCAAFAPATSDRGCGETTEQI